MLGRAVDDRRKFGMGIDILIDEVTRCTVWDEREHRLAKNTVLMVVRLWSATIKPSRGFKDSVICAAALSTIFETMKSTKLVKARFVKSTCFGVAFQCLTILFCVSLS